MEWWNRLKRERIVREVERLGYELDEVLEALAEVLGREVPIQTPDPGTQQLSPLQRLPLAGA
jgi:hypothetical protein